MKRDKIKTPIEEIVRYWSRTEDECGLSVDFSEAHERCWRCGSKRHLERAHIIPDSLGGKDEPSNLVLLCRRCHLDNPNVADPEIMWDWLRSYAVPFYDTFWILQGYEEYEKIYSISFFEELEKRGITRKQQKEIDELMHRQIKKASYHFGDPHLNVATLAGICRMALKEYDQLHHLQTSKQIKPHINIGKYL